VRVSRLSENHLPSRRDGCRCIGVRCPGAYTRRPSQQKTHKTRGKYLSNLGKCSSALPTIFSTPLPSCIPPTSIREPSTMACQRVHANVLNWRSKAPTTGKFLPKALINFSNADIDAVLTCSCDRCDIHRRLLATEGRGQINPIQYSEQIRQTSLSLFVLLVWIKKAAFIVAFVSHGIDDERAMTHLGLQRCVWAEFPAFQVMARRSGAANVLLELTEEIEDNWTEFLRPRIGGAHFQNINQRFKLPFYNQRRIGSGASGIVYAFKIYPGYNAIKVCLLN